MGGGFTWILLPIIPAILSKQPQGFQSWPTFLKNATYLKNDFTG
jgi:hypothetical protein